ncbi:MAG: phosphoribosyltransferase family protein [Patescibacteria group bacterium]|nr:phosphoribosyltransferase family protein [Patescibacteria group bacterium]
MIFADRQDAGQQLAALAANKIHSKGLVLGIPRGGVVVAKVVADKLKWPLRVLAAKKISDPGNPELALGAKVKPTSLEVSGLNIVLVDDGIATGYTVEAAVKWLRSHQAKKITVAVPVCAVDTARRLKPLVDQWLCLHEADNLYAVGQFYRQFSQVADEEVLQLLA